MAKKLTEEKCSQIMEVGIAEFAARGYDGANTNTIARKAGISVGVLFKYYGDKEGFFLACLQRSLDILTQVLEQVEQAEGKPLEKAEALFRTLIAFSRQHGDYIRMYHMITAISNPALSRKLAGEIEGVSARVYGAYMAQMQAAGEVRRDIPPAAAAFFFDNMLMMLQFTYSCDYYKERLYLYTGVPADDEAADEAMIRQMRLLAEGALGAGSERGELHGVCAGV